MPEFGTHHPSLDCPRIHATLPIRAGQGVLRAPLPGMETAARLAKGEAERDDPTHGPLAISWPRVRRESAEISRAMWALWAWMELQGEFQKE